MRIVYCGIYQEPKAIVVPNELHPLQELVGGYIESVPYCKNMVILCNEEGRLLGLPVGGAHGLAGNYLYVKTRGDKFVSMTEAEAKGVIQEDLIARRNANEHRETQKEQHELLRAQQLERPQKDAD